MTKFIDALIILTISLSTAEIYLENFYSAVYIILYTVILHMSCRLYDLKYHAFKVLFELHLFVTALISAKVVLGLIKYFGV